MRHLLKYLILLLLLFSNCSGLRYEPYPYSKQDKSEIHCSKNASNDWDCTKSKRGDHD